jgi:hypothetical protein
MSRYATCCSRAASPCTLFSWSQQQTILHVRSRNVLSDRQDRATPHLASCPANLMQLSAQKWRVGVLHLATEHLISDHHNASHPAHAAADTGNSRSCNMLSEGHATPRLARFQPIYSAAGST